MPLKIAHRFHFSSALKRMSAIAGYMPTGSMEPSYIATAKGAPEMLKTMVFILKVPAVRKFLTFLTNFSIAEYLKSAEGGLEGPGGSEIFDKFLNC